MNWFSCHQRSPIVLVLLLVITMLVFSGCARHGSGLEPDTIIVQRANRIWLVNPVTLEESLLLDYDDGQNTQIRGLALTHDRRHILAVRGKGTGGLMTYSEADQVIRIDVNTQAIDVLLERPYLLGVSDISPDGKQAVVAYLRAAELRAAAIFCILNVDTGNCEELDFPIQRLDTYWIDNDTIVAVSADDGSLYSINSDNLETERIEVVPEDHSVDSTDRIPGTNDFLVSLRLIGETFEPKLVVLDPMANEASELPFQVIDSDFYYSFGRLSISPDGQYVWYNWDPRYALLDLQTGEHIQELEGVGLVNWLSNSEEIVATTSGDEDSVEQLVRINVFSGQIEQSVQIDGHVSSMIVVP